MKKKNIILGAISGLFALLTIIPLCIGNWVQYAGEEVSKETAGMFQDWTNVAKAYGEKTFPKFWATLIAICAIVALVAGVCYIALYALDLAKVTKPGKTDLLKKILSIVMIAAAVIILISGIIFMSASKLEQTLPLVGTVSTGFKGVAGFYLAWIFPLIAGVAGLLGSLSSKKR